MICCPNQGLFDCGQCSRDACMGCRALVARTENPEHKTILRVCVRCWPVERDFFESDEHERVVERMRERSTGANAVLQLARARRERDSAVATRDRAVSERDHAIKTIHDSRTYESMSEFERLKQADVDQGKRIAELLAENAAQCADYDATTERLTRLADGLVAATEGSHEPTPIETVESLVNGLVRDYASLRGQIKDIIHVVLDDRSLSPGTRASWCHRLEELIQ